MPFKIWRQSGVLTKKNYITTAWGLKGAKAFLFVWDRKCDIVFIFVIRILFGYIFSEYSTDLKV